ncbi:MAG TPA: VOC family protein [Alphaproteobacteria bacterium]|nr:VOC family protein [Alphaproteobacteria bacterium]
MIFDHIGLFVSDLSAGHKQFAAMLPVAKFSPEIDDPLLKVRVQFLWDSSGTRYELVAPLGADSPVSGALASGNNILNHVAYRVADLDVEIARLRQQRCMPFGTPQPAVAFNNARVIFLLTPLQFIIELIEDKP